MPARNYIVSTNDMTLSDKKAYRLGAIAAGLERCVVKKIGNVEADIPNLETIPQSNTASRVQHILNYIQTGAWPRSIDVRELRPGSALDLVVATAIDSWLTAALAAVGTAYSCFQAVVTPQLLDGKIMVCYGVSIDSAAVPLPVSRLTFLRGVNVQAIFDLEPLMVRDEVEGFFSEPVVIDPREGFAINALARNATGVAEIVHIHNFLFENAGLTIA